MNTAKYFEALKRAKLYMDLWKQQHPGHNGNWMDDSIYVDNAINELSIIAITDAVSPETR